MKNLGFNYKISAEVGNYHQLDNMFTWCNETFGPRYGSFSNNQGRWACLWQQYQKTHGYFWYFRQEEDAAFFTLRWIK